MFEVVRVQDVIMDPSHPKYLGQSSIGAICYTYMDDPPPDNILQTEIALPLNSNISHVPVPNEIVFLILAPSKSYNEDSSLISYYLYPHAIYQDPNSNALPNAIDGQNSFYKGNFIELENIRPLVPFDGDILIEGRFGNSIRFGSTNNPNTYYKNQWSNEATKETLGDPITIIRNGQKQLNNKFVNNFDHILENINDDHSSIYLCSKQNFREFQPASLHDASYSVDIFKQNEVIDEPDLDNEGLEEEVVEDISLNEASPLPPQDAQIADELSDYEPTDTAYYDISLTETQTLSTQNEITLPPSYVVPDTVDMNYLMEEM